MKKQEVLKKLKNENNYLYVRFKRFVENHKNENDISDEVDDDELIDEIDTPEKPESQKLIDEVDDDELDEPGESIDYKKYEEKLNAQLKRCKVKLNELREYKLNELKKQIEKDDKFYRWK